MDGSAVVRAKSLLSLSLHLMSRTICPPANLSCHSSRFHTGLLPATSHILKVIRMVIPIVVAIQSVLKVIPKINVVVFIPIVPLPPSAGVPAIGCNCRREDRSSFGRRHDEAHSDPAGFRRVVRIDPKELREPLLGLCDQ